MTLSIIAKLKHTAWHLCYTPNNSNAGHYYAECRYDECHRAECLGALPSSYDVTFQYV
jgi:hypothetical protein